MVLFCIALASCTTQQVLERAPARPDAPWVDPVPANVSLPPLDAPAVPIDAQQPLSLMQLIDIAQRENPLTRQAWNTARTAALGVGMVEATFLPMLSANVLAGHMSSRYPLKHSILGHDAIHTRSSGVMPLLALSWLLFDFGQRDALLEAAEHTSFAANVLFNAAHQNVIRDVTDAYYQHMAARERVELAQQALAQQRVILNAAQARFSGGVGTSLDVALGQQAVSQARLHLVNSQGLQKTTRLALLRAMGLPPDTPLQIADPDNVALPPTIEPLTTQALRQALSQRPDLVAEYGTLRAAQANVRAAEADFLPKVFVGAVYGHRRNDFQAGNLPQLQIPATSNGVMLGVTLPLFDGGLRRSQLRTAEITAEQAQDHLQSLQRDAISEMVAAETALQSALQSYRTAEQLVRTARTAHRAALDSYREGLGTLTVATEASTQLLLARQARADAHTASLVAAANLAFATGAMVSPQEQWLPEKPGADTPPSGVKRLQGLSTGKDATVAK